MGSVGWGKNIAKFYIALTKTTTHTQPTKMTSSAEELSSKAALQTPGASWLQGHFN